MALTRLKQIRTLQEILPTLPRFTGELTFSPNVLWNKKISIWQGDMTKLEIDAIVNAANSSLLGGGGIDGAIHRAAGPDLMKECRTLRGCDTGDAKITKGYRLPAEHIIHAVGPQGEKPWQLASCYNRVLEVLTENGLSSVAFCCISTGIYGYPPSRAARVALETVRSWMDDHAADAKKIERIVFCTFLDTDKLIYERLLPEFFPFGRDDSQQSEDEDGSDSEGENTPSYGSKV